VVEGKVRVQVCTTDVKDHPLTQRFYFCFVCFCLLCAFALGSVLFLVVAVVDDSVSVVIDVVDSVLTMVVVVVVVVVESQVSILHYPVCLSVVKDMQRRFVILSSPGTQRGYLL